MNVAIGNIPHVISSGFQGCLVDATTLNGDAESIEKAQKNAQEARDDRVSELVFCVETAAPRLPCGAYGAGGGSEEFVGGCGGSRGARVLVQQRAFRCDPGGRIGGALLPSPYPDNRLMRP